MTAPFVMLAAMGHASTLCSLRLTIGVVENTSLIGYTD
jgi:hypothetical protein